MIPDTPDATRRAVDRSRKMVRRRALAAAGVSIVPIPGVDWLTDIGILLKLLPAISREFGLSPQQVEQLSPQRQVVVYKALSAAGGLVAGKLVTRELVLMLLKTVGVRLSTQQVAKFIPLAGQAVSAALTYSALTYVCGQHIRQCEAVARQLMLPAPDPAPMPDAMPTGGALPPAS